MLFNSYIFILAFLPLAVVGYFLLNRIAGHRWGKLFLFGMSCWFYSYFDLRYLPYLLVSIGGNYLVYRLFRRIRAPRWRKLLLIAALAANLGALVYFKYIGFLIENLSALLRLELALEQLLVPLAISYFTFQQVAFLVDCCRDQVPECGLADYALFIAYFPKLVSGPIVTQEQLLPQLADPSKAQLNWDHLSRGLYQFSLGLGKKVLLADTFGAAAAWGFGNIPALNSIDAFLVILAYGFQLYFDFSGYCDMACGISRMLNIDLPVNFNSPYKALTITDFWARWHMTLTRFFTRYLYIPLGGSRRGAARTYVNTLIIFLVSGLWHGANWTFLLWGAMHGVFMVITKAFKKQFDRLHPALNWLITFSFVNLTWVFFRAASIGQALAMLKQLLYLNFGPISSGLLKPFALPELEALFLSLFRLDIAAIGQPPYTYLYLLLFFCIAFFLVLGCRNAGEKADAFRPTVLTSFTTALLLVWCIFSLAGMSTFLYFNF